MGNAEDEYDFDFIEPDPDLYYARLDREYLRRVITRQRDEIRRRKAARDLARQRDAS